MRITTSDNYDYALYRRDDGWVEVRGTPEAIEVMVDTIALTGTATVAVSGVERPSGVRMLPSPNRLLESRLAVLPDTVAKWWTFESLYYI